MTVELGNTNKGIPMGNYAPGEGGGGTAKVTGVDPIAVTNGSVAIKIDEQTLQVNEQGELSANLDEIGSELSDLSGRVTAAEADILNKQDTIVPEKPLVLGKQIIKNYKGMIIADGKISSVGGQNFTATNDSTFTIKAGNAAPPVSYIEMPYKSGQVIQVPTNVYNNANGKLGLFFGSWQDDGNFLVTAAFTPEDSYKASNGCFGGLFSDGPISMPSTETTPALRAYHNVHEKAEKYITLVPDKNSYFQILMSDTSWVIQLYASGLYNNTVHAYTWVIPDSSIGTTKFSTITPKTNTCLIMMNNSSLKVPTDSIGLYDWGTRLQWSQAGYQDFLANKGANLFSLEKQGENDSLSLTIGSGLSVVDGKLTATGGGGGASDPEKYGLEGDYCSKYGIVDCPNGILAEGTGKVTLKAGVVMQMTETDGLTTNASDMPHDITSTVDFDLFYTSGGLLEATQVVFSKQEPEDGATGVLAWYNGAQWQFKSNDAGNVWRAAPAVRLAHIHITDGNITRIDYIGNRHLNKAIPVTTDTDQTITGQKTFNKVLMLRPSEISSSTIPHLRFKVNTGLESTWYADIVSTRTNANTGVSTIYFGSAQNPLQFKATELLSNTGKKILNQGSITAGDNISITKTTDGIQISSTSIGGVTINDILPDYTARIELGGYTSASNQFTAPCAGYIVPLLSLAYNTDRYAPYINGVRHGYGSIDKTPSIAFSDVFFIVNKGDKFYSTGIASHLDAGGFYPMKGANK